MHDMVGKFPCSIVKVFINNVDELFSYFVHLFNWRL